MGVLMSLMNLNWKATAWTIALDIPVMVSCLVCLSGVSQESVWLWANSQRQWTEVGVSGARGLTAPGLVAQECNQQRGSATAPSESDLLKADRLSDSPSQTTKMYHRPQAGVRRQVLHGGAEALPHVSHQTLSEQQAHVPRDAVQRVWHRAVSQPALPVDSRRQPSWVERLAISQWEFFSISFHSVNFTGVLYLRSYCLKLNSVHYISIEKTTCMYICIFFFSRDSSKFRCACRMTIKIFESWMSHRWFSNTLICRKWLHGAIIINRWDVSLCDITEGYFWHTLSENTKQAQLATDGVFLFFGSSVAAKDELVNISVEILTSASRCQ